MTTKSLENIINEYEEHFVEKWNRIFREYKRKDNCVWLAGPTAYVFSLEGQKFAVDLQIRREQERKKVKGCLLEQLSELSFVLITHQHDDHMCIPLMQELANTNIKWYIPYGTRADLIEKSKLKEENIIWVKAGDVWKVGKIQIRAFETPHTKPGEKIFLQCGYEITTPGGKILIPGDVRDYDYTGYPDFGDVDMCFAHLWAGNNALDEESYMPILKEFVRFHAELQAKQYFLCHLYEIGRSSTYMWHDGHAAIAKDLLSGMLPNSKIVVPGLGDSYSIAFREEK